MDILLLEGLRLLTGELQRYLFPQFLQRFAVLYQAPV